jgi:hypothetical protein
MINLTPIKIKKDQIKNEQQQIYKKIFKDICNIINLKIIEGRHNCIYKIPSFIFGELSFPFNECVEYLYKKLKDLKEIKVKFYYPNVFFIQWNDT